MAAGRAFSMACSLSLCTAACGGGGATPTRPGHDTSSDATPEASGDDAPGLDGDALDADSGRIVLAAADPDAAACVVSANDYPGLTCFGSDPAPYLTFLVPDSGVAVGQCPAQRDFLAPRGEGAGPCGHFVCGPLRPAAVAGLRDAAVPVEADGGVCCFWAVEVCGV